MQYGALYDYTFQKKKKKEENKNKIKQEKKKRETKQDCTFLFLQTNHTLNNNIHLLHFFSLYKYIDWKTFNFFLTQVKGKQIYLLS